MCNQLTLCVGRIPELWDNGPWLGLRQLELLVSVSQETQVTCLHIRNRLTGSWGKPKESGGADEDRVKNKAHRGIVRAVGISGDAGLIGGFARPMDQGDRHVHERIVSGVGNSRLQASVHS